MPKGIPRNWPSDDELVEFCKKHRSLNAAGAAMVPSCAQSILARYLKKIGRKEEMDLHYRNVKALLPDVLAQEKISQEEMLRQEVSELKKALNKARSEDVKFERVLSSIEEYLPVLSSTYKPKALKKNKEKDYHSLVLLWSDQHAAEVVTLEGTSGLNEYNWEIMMQRHDELRRGIKAWAEVFAPIEKLLILSLGDGLSGNIHDELAETNEMPMAEAAVRWGVEGATWLQTLPDVIPWLGSADVEVTCVPGNHPRAHRKPRAKSKHDNGDWVSANIMRQALMNESWINFDIPRSSRHIVDVYGRKILAMHGDGVPPSAMVGVPWGGIIRMDHRLRNQFAYDHLALGHFHEANVIGNRRIWVNGSVKGDDEYGIEKYGGGHTATQMLVPFHPRRGMVGAQYIDLV